MDGLVFRNLCIWCLAGLHVFDYARRLRTTTFSSVFWNLLSSSVDCFAIVCSVLPQEPVVVDYCKHLSDGRSCTTCRRHTRRCCDKHRVLCTVPSVMCADHNVAATSPFCRMTLSITTASQPRKVSSFSLGLWLLVKQTALCGPRAPRLSRIQTKDVNLGHL